MSEHEETKRRDIRARLIILAAQMARGEGMPDPEGWPGWRSSGVSNKLRYKAITETERALATCRDWAYEISELARKL